MSALMQLIAKAKQKYATGNDALRPKDGRNTFRILAPSKDQADWVGPDGEFWQDLGVHWIKADVNGKPLAVVGDASACFGEANPLEAVIEKAVAQAIGEEEKKLTEGWRSQKRVLLNVLDRTDPKNLSDNPQVLEVPRGVWGSILEQASAYAALGYDIFDQKTGLDIVITKTGKNLSTKYDVSVAPLLPGHMPTPVTDEIMAKVQNLPEWVRGKYFKGEENKALALIAQTAGIAVPGAGPAITARTPTAALTSGAAVAEGAKVASAPVAEAAVSEVVEEAPFDTGVISGEIEDNDAALAELDALLLGNSD